jgi:hypothetical protein
MDSSPAIDCMKNDEPYYRFSSKCFRLKMFDLFSHLISTFPNTLNSLKEPFNQKII